MNAERAKWPATVKEAVADVRAAVLLYPSSTRSSQAVRLRVQSAQASADAEILALGISIPAALAEIGQGVRGTVTRAIIDAIQQGIGVTVPASGY